jgi:hypothetical protein
MYEADLKGADARNVAWEAKDDRPKDAFRKGPGCPPQNAGMPWGPAFTSLRSSSALG